MSCDPSANGFQTISDYVLGPSGEQMTEMAMDANNSMAWQHTNVWAGGKLLATYDPDGLHFYLNDPLGTRRAQTDYAGVLEQTCQSLPFGDALNCTNSTQYPTEHHFTGKERDSESGNDYFGARYYSSAMGRFMSPDWSATVEPVPYAKLDNPQSLNLYAYVGNNPLTSVDPDGHNPPVAGQDACTAAFQGNLKGCGLAVAAKQQGQVSGGSPQQSGRQNTIKLRIPLIAVANGIPQTGKINSKRGRFVDYFLYELQKDGSLGLRNTSFTISLKETYIYGHADEICNHSQCNGENGYFHDQQFVFDGNSYAVKREWSANGVSIPVWNPNTNKPAQLEQLYLQFNSEFRMEYK
jgi:RHS repeat-associated protein